MIPGERQHPLLHHGALHVVIDQDHVFLESLDGEEFLFALQLCEQHLMDVRGVLSRRGPAGSPVVFQPGSTLGLARAQVFQAHFCRREGGVGVVSGPEINPIPISCCAHTRALFTLGHLRPHVPA